MAVPGKPQPRSSLASRPSGQGQASPFVLREADDHVLTGHWLIGEALHIGQPLLMERRLWERQPAEPRRTKSWAPRKLIFQRREPGRTEQEKTTKGLGNIDC